MKRLRFCSMKLYERFKINFRLLIISIDFGVTKNSLEYVSFSDRLLIDTCVMAPLCNQLVLEMMPV